MSYKSFEDKRSSNGSLMRIDRVFFTDLERLCDDSKEGMQRKRLEDNLYGFLRKSRCCLRICRDDNNAKRQIWPLLLQCLKQSIAIHARQVKVKQDE